MYRWDFWYSGTARGGVHVQYAWVLIIMLDHDPARTYSWYNVLIVGATGDAAVCGTGSFDLATAARGDSAK